MGRSSIYNSLFDSSTTFNSGTPFFKSGSKIMQLMYEKKEFLILVFANLIAQLGITYYVMERTTNIKVSSTPLFIAQLIILFVMILVPMPEIIKFLLFCLFSYTWGLSLSKLKKEYNSDMINVAIQGVLTVFAVFVVAGITLIAGGINLGYRFGAILFWTLLALIVARLIFITSMNQAHKILSFIGIILFAMYVMYDTNIILQRNYYGDFITASMDYYLDILNLFTSFLGFSNN